jgi:hypothetical protein
MSHWKPNAKRFDRLPLYNALTGAGSRLIAKQPALAEYLTEVAARVVTMPRPNPTAFKEAAARVEEHAAAIVEEDVAEELRKFAYQLYELANRLRYAAGESFRRSCWCGKHTLSTSVTPKDWGARLSQWRCPEHKPPPPPPTAPRTPEERRELAKLNRAIAGMFGFAGGREDDD